LLKQQKSATGREAFADFERQIPNQVHSEQIVFSREETPCKEESVNDQQVQ